MKGKRCSSVEVLDMQIGMEPFVLDRIKDDANNSAYLCLLLIIQLLSRSCNIFSARSIAPKECYLTMNFEENHFTVLKISEK